MPVTAAQKTAIEGVLKTITGLTSSKKKRQLAEMFLELVDRESWADYYEVIPEPRSLKGISEKLKANKYKDALQVYEDLTLVFLNALYYNEPTSQIAKDAQTLKTLLATEWRQHAVLPAPPESPPQSSAQKQHADTESAVAPAPPAVAAVAEPAAAVAPTPSPVTVPTPATLTPTPAPAPGPTLAPVAVLPKPALTKSPQRPLTPDIEIDVGGTPEPESMGVGEPMARDVDGDAIVQQLERGLPRWEGLADVAWMAHGTADRWLEVVLAIKSHKDIIGNRLSVALEVVPEESTVPYLSYNFPLSLKLIETRARSKGYDSAKAFDKEMIQLFEKARKWHEPGSEAYGRVLLLQRLYQAITSPNPPAGPPYASATNFASLPAGPGTARPLHSSDSEKQPGVTTFRVSTKDKTFVDEVQYKGWTIRLADWLHLSNPDDPAKPIIAQVFKCYVSDEPSKRGQPGVSVCWYYRPEQTFHPAHRQFWEGEVFKTSHFADHPVEDVIEKIACQFTARHIRGRPRPPYWYLGWPLYVCDSRYNDRERIFVKIKNWNSCVPEEVRKSTEFMPIYPFERPVHPRLFASPFLQGKLKGPGGIGDSVEKVEGEKVEGGGTGRKRSKKSHPSATDISGPSKGLYVGIPGATITPATPAMGSLGGYSSYAGQYGLPLQGQRAQSTQPRPTEDRSIVTAAGGLAALGNSITMEKLPPETARHFDRDPETNEVLWFSAPPINIAHQRAPTYSLKYLHWLATKRKRSAQGANATDDDQEGGPAQKKQRARPTVSESINALWADLQLDASS